VSLFIGKTYFRNNILPYLTKIKAEIASNSGGGNPPIVTSTDITEIPISTVTTITVTGDFFSPSMVVSCGTATITNYVFITQQSCTFDITTATPQSNTITYTGGGGSDTSTITSTVSNWIDLRTGGDTYTESHDPGTTITQDATGLSSTGSLWDNWLRIDSHSWSRSNLKRVSIIVKSGNTHMVGILSELQGEGSASQYYEGEIWAYASGSNLIYFYGTNSLGAGTSQDISNSALSYTYHKVVFENNGQPGSTFRVYGFNSLADFDDNSNLLGSDTVASNMNANGSTLKVGTIFGNTSNRLVAFLIEDM